MVKNDANVTVSGQEDIDAVIGMKQGPYAVHCSVPEDCDRITEEDKINVKTEADSVDDVRFPSTCTEELINVKREMTEATAFVGVKVETDSEEVTTVKTEVKKESTAGEAEVDALDCGAIVGGELCHCEEEFAVSDRPQAATSNVPCCKQKECFSSVCTACGITFTSDPMCSSRTCSLCSEAACKIKVQPQPVTNEVNNGGDSACVQHVPQGIHTSHKDKTHQLPKTLRNRKEERSDIAFQSKRLKCKKSGAVRKKTDEYGAFGKFVAQELRSLHSEVNRRQLKRMIQKAVLKVSELDDKKQATDEKSLNWCSGLAENC